MKRAIFLLLSITFFLSARMFAGDKPIEVRAVRINNPPQIDGILDEDVWKATEPAKDFIQRDPDEGISASEPTEIRVLYDDDALYFGCMFYDSEPDKIVARLTRRDNEIESDFGSIRIDSYHDNQTGYEFTFNPAGVKVDILQYDDANREDESWDPVWELQTKITPQGWSAEVKIPFRILRYRSDSADTTDNVWGINFLRTISRKQESDRWAFTPKSQNGFISRFGHLVGLKNLPAPKHFELMPFVTAKQSYDPARDEMARQIKFAPNAGIDLKYGISSNFTLDATINPDFGQVEADPAVLNLSTFETFYPEKRPFFIEGTQILHFTTFGGDFGPGMFYSRRVGRALSFDEVDVPTKGRIEKFPQTTTILGAAKLTGKTSDGLSIGLLEAFTEEEKATVSDSANKQSDQVLEPFAHYNIIRLKQDILGNSNVGMIITSVEKNSRYPAFTNGYDWNVKLDENTYLLDGFLAFSHRTTRDGESRTGSAGKIHFGKVAGEHWLWSLSSDFTSKRYNINDVGFFFRPNDFGGNGSVTYKEDVPAEVVRYHDIGFSLHERRNFDGVNLSRESRLSSELLFTNYWRIEGEVGVDIGMYDDRETRGNGLYRKPRNYRTGLSLETDERNDVVFYMDQKFVWDSKFKKQVESEIAVSLKPLSWMEWDFEYVYQHVKNQEAWFESIIVGDFEKSIFADRSTIEHNFTLRSTITFTRDITLQFYSQVFLAKVHHNNYRQLVGTSNFESPDHFSPEDQNEQSLNTNIVLRWEYLLGSTLYLVWSQARSNEKEDYFDSFKDDIDDTFRVPPTNILLLKASYWFSI